MAYIKLAILRAKQVHGLFSRKAKTNTIFKLNGLSTVKITRQKNITILIKECMIYSKKDDQKG